MEGDLSSSMAYYVMLGSQVHTDTHRHTQTHTDRQTDRQTDSQTREDKTRQPARQTRQPASQTEKPTAAAVVRYRRSGRRLPAPWSGPAWRGHR